MRSIVPATEVIVGMADITILKGEETMYAEHKNYVRYFTVEGKEGTEKVHYGRLSESFKTDKTDEKGRELYEYETWDARFVGAAKAKVEKLKNGQSIALTKWAARCPYSKEHKRCYPYLLVMDFDIVLSKGENSSS